MRLLILGLTIVSLAAPTAWGIESLSEEQIQESLAHLPQVG